MATSSKPAAGEQLAPTVPIATKWDWINGRLTLSSKSSPLLLEPDNEIVMTFETLEILFHSLYTAALLQRGVLQQAQPMATPSGSPSDLSRSLHLERPQ